MRSLADDFGRVPGESDGAIDHGGEFGASERVERDPQLKSIKASAGEKGSSDEIGNAGFFVRFGIEIVGVHAHGIEEPRIAQKKRAAWNRLPEELMKVDGDGVGALDAG